MAEGGGGEDLGGYGDRKRREMLDRIEGRKKRGVADLQPVDVALGAGDVEPDIVPLVGEVLQPSVPASPSLGAKPRLPSTRIMELAESVK